jgi:hypothetical protein
MDTVFEELEPDPIPDPPVDSTELLAVTKEFKISKPAIVDDPLVNEPPPIPEPRTGLGEGTTEPVLASTRESRIRIKPIFEEPVEIEPVPIPEAPDNLCEPLIAVTVELQI